MDLHYSRVEATAPLSFARAGGFCRAAILPLALLAAALSVGLSIHYALTDPWSGQDTQWGPARALLRHEDPYRLFFETQWLPAGERAFLMNQRPHYFPSSLVMLWPIAPLPWPIARAAWLILNIGFAGMIVRLLARRLPDRRASTVALFGALFLASSPLAWTLRSGQHGLFTLGFFCLAWHFEERGRGMPAALALAAAWFKHHLGGPLTIFFLRPGRGPRAIGGAMLVHLALLLFAAAWVGTPPHTLMLGAIRVSGLLSTGYVDLLAIPRKIGLVWVLWSLYVVVALLAAAWLVARRERDDLSLLAMLSLLTLVVVFHSDYDFIVLIFPLAYIFRERRIAPRTVAYGFVIALFWYGDHLYYVLGRPDRLDVTDGFYWTKVAAIYGALGLDLWVGIRKNYFRRENELRTDAQIGRTRPE